jgi:hypothetical protein
MTITEMHDYLYSEQIYHTAPDFAESKDDWMRLRMIVWGWEWLCESMSAQ